MKKSRPKQLLWMEFVCEVKAKVASNSINGTIAMQVFADDGNAGGKFHELKQLDATDVVSPQHF